MIEVYQHSTQSTLYYGASEALAKIEADANPDCVILRDFGGPHGTRRDLEGGVPAIEPTPAQGPKPRPGSWGWTAENAPRRQLVAAAE
jgi:hypothetical protein